MPAVCKLTFGKELPRDITETQLALAVRVTEAVYGPPRVRIGAGYCYAADGTVLVLDISTEVGQHIACVLIGLLTWAHGEDSFAVERDE